MKAKAEKNNAVAVQEPQDMVSQIVRLARDPSVDADKLERLVKMQRELMKDEATRAFYESMANVQAIIAPIVKKDRGEKSPYAKLERIEKEIRPIYTKEGFSITYGAGTATVEGEIKVVAKLLHKMGHSESYELQGALDMAGPKGGANKTAIQGLGSSVSYLRRYLLTLIFNLILEGEDNDGNKQKKQQEDFITQDQEDLIEQYLNALEINKEKFLLAYKINALHEMGQIPFNHAIETFKAREAERNKK